MTETNSLLLPRRNEHPDFGSGSTFFVGNATVLIRYAGFTILTDPNFLHAGEHVHLGYGLSSKRTTNPAVEIEDLPPLDFVLLSHLHGDHFDRVAERKLNKAMRARSSGSSLLSIAHEATLSTLWAVSPLEGFMPRYSASSSQKPESATDSKYVDVGLPATYARSKLGRERRRIPQRTSPS